MKLKPIRQVVFLLVVGLGAAAQKEGAFDSIWRALKDLTAAAPGSAGSPSAATAQAKPNAEFSDYRLLPEDAAAGVRIYARDVKFSWRGEDLHAEVSGVVVEANRGEPVVPFDYLTLMIRKYQWDQWVYTYDAFEPNVAFELSPGARYEYKGPLSITYRKQADDCGTTQGCFAQLRGRLRQQAYATTEWIAVDPPPQ